MKSKKLKGSSRKASPNRIRNAWIIFGGLWGVIILFFLFLSWGWLGKIPSFDQLENPSSLQSSEVISADGEILGFIGLENRSDVSYSQISPNVINALIATEDVRFMDHSGIDTRSLGRVFFKTLLGRHSSSGGGSTITQQLAKNLFTLDGRARAKSKLGTVYYKFKEWVVAVKLERTYSKQEILAMYLNTVDYGSNAFGIKTAAKTFFDKAPADLNVEEAAVLVGLLKAPTAYSPKLYPERSIARRNVVLSQMKHYDYLSEAEYDSISALPINMSHYAPQSHNEGLATYLREYVRSYMKEWCKTHRKPNGECYDVHKDGLRVYTTIDSRMQRYAEEAVVEHLGGYIQPNFFKEVNRRKGNPFVDYSEQQQEQLLTRSMKASERYQDLKDEGHSEKEIRRIFNEKVPMQVFGYRIDGSGHAHTTTIDTTLSPWDSLLYYKKFINCGLVAVEPGTGAVKAYVGGINYRHFKYDNVQSHRQVGSTFKPFVYAMAIQNYGFTPDTVVPCAEVCFEMPDGQPDYCPKNAGGKNPEGDVITLRRGLAGSYNWVSAYLMKYQSGMPDYNSRLVIDIAEKMGLDDDYTVSSLQPVPSLCVGTAEPTCMEMAGAMAAFANLGQYVEPIIITKITDSKGMVLATFKPERHEAIQERTAYYVIELMKGVIRGGTGSRLMSSAKYSLAEFGAQIAGKTGTTQNNSDAWFMGVTPKLATAIWTGGEVRYIHFRNGDLGQGARQSMPIYGYFMRKVYQDKSINLYRGDFPQPSQPLEAELPDLGDPESNETSDGFIW